MYSKYYYHFALVFIVFLLLPIQAVAGALTLTITTNNDDVEINGSSLWYSGEPNSIYIGEFNNVNTWGAFRFTLTSAIPSNAIISSGTVLQTYNEAAWQWDSASDYLKIWADDSCDATQVDNANDQPGGAGGHTTTTAVVRWPASGGLTWQIGAFYDTPDLATLIQELVSDCGGLSNGAHVMIWITRGQAQTAGPGEVPVEDFSATGTNHSRLVINWNTPPSITAGPSDGGSDGTSPTNVGSNVSFTTTATDPEADQYYLVLCKTNAIAANASAAPTCTGGSWAISSTANSASEASVTYTTLIGDSESNDWYAFVCDHNAASQCSASSQGSGSTGSPFKVDHAPAFSAVTDSPDPQIIGSDVTFATTASDTNTDTSADTVKLYVCKANDATFAGCGAGGTWASAALTASNPSASYTTLVGNVGANTYYAFIYDSHNMASASNPRSGTFTVSPAPTATSVAGQNPQTTAGGYSITINGTNFVSTPTVTIGGTAATGVTWVSATELTATAPAKTAGTYNVVVTNPDTQTGTCTNCMTYEAPLLTPPASGSGYFNPTFSNSGFVRTDAIRGGTVVYDFNDGSAGLMRVPPDATAGQVINLGIGQFHLSGLPILSPLPAGATIVGPIFRFTAALDSGVEANLTKKATIVIDITDTSMQLTRFDRASLAIYRYDKTHSVWEMSQTIITTHSANLISAGTQTDQFGLFALLSVTFLQQSSSADIITGSESNAELQSQNHVQPSLPTTTSLSGIVTIENSNGAPLVEAIVTLQPINRTVRTDTAGRYQFTGLEEGNYTFTITKVGYNSYKSADFIVSAKKEAVKNFRLSVISKTTTLINIDLTKRLSGRILLPAEHHGEAWYIDPVTLTRYFVGDPSDAFKIMREQGLGITNANLQGIPVAGRTEVMPVNLRRLSGRILLQVESKGEAWYIHPVTLKRHYLGRPADAFRIMREQGLGINDKELVNIPTSDALNDAR